jgi:hypothetical protein
LCAVVAAIAPISLLIDTHGLAVLFRAVQHSRLPAPDLTVVAEPVESTAPEPVSATVPVPVPGSVKRRDPVKLARAVELRGEGRSFPQIAAELGVSISTARKYVLSGAPVPDDGSAAVADPVPVPAPMPAPAPVAAVVLPARPVAAARPVPVRPVQQMLPIAAS